MARTTNPQGWAHGTTITETKLETLESQPAADLCELYGLATARSVAITRDASTGQITALVVDGITYPVSRNAIGLPTRIGPTGNAPVFARTSVARQLNGAAVTTGTPRYETLGGIQGVLVAPSAQNLAQQSDTADDSYWTKTNCTVTPNDTTAPDGTTTADKITDDATNGRHQLERASRITSGQPAAIVFLAKNVDAGWCACGTTLTQTTAWFNLAAGVVGTKGSGVSWSDMIDLGSGWYLCMMFCPAASITGTGDLRFHVATSDNVVSYVGTGQSIYVAGLTYTQNLFPGQPIATTSAAATRNAESIAIPTQATIKPDEFTVEVFAYVRGDNGLAAPAASHYLFHHKDGSGNNEIALYRAAAGLLTARVSDNAGSATTVTYAAGAIATGWHWFAIRLKAGRLSLWLDGIEVGNGVPATRPSVVATNMYVGSDNASANQWGWPIRCLRVTPTWRTDDDLRVTGIATSTDASNDDIAGLRKVWGAAMTTYETQVYDLTYTAANRLASTIKSGVTI